MAFTEFLVGKREKISWVAETGYGTGGTIGNGEVIGLNAIMTPNFDPNFQETLSAGTDTLAVEDHQRGFDRLLFNVNFTPVNWVWLKYLFTNADAGAGPFTHTFTENTSISSFKLEWARRHTTNSVITILGGTVKSATVSFAKPSGAGREGHVNVNLSCVGKSQSEGSTVAGTSAITLAPYQFRHAKLTLNNVETVELNNGEVTINRGVDENDVLYCNATLDTAIGEPIPKTLRVFGRFNVNIKDNTHHTLWETFDAIANTKLELIRGTNDKIVMTFNNFHIVSPNGPTNLEGVTNIDIVFVAEGFSSLVATDSIATY